MKNSKINQELLERINKFNDLVEQYKAGRFHATDRTLSNFYNYMLLEIQYFGKVAKKLPNTKETLLMGENVECLMKAINQDVAKYQANLLFDLNQ